MAAKFGHCFKELGEGAKAEQFAVRSLNMVDGYVRGRAFNVVLLANAYLQQTLTKHAPWATKRSTLAPGLNQFGQSDTSATCGGG
jgi:hypothetical protein